MQSSTKKKQKQYQLVCPELPLAVYREVAAHLRQVESVEAGLIYRPLNDPQGKFDYRQSQIQALWIAYPEDLSGDCALRISTADRNSQIQAILDYYAQRYRPWESLEQTH